MTASAYVEQLESRQLLTTGVAAVGVETRVNTYTPGSQQYPAVATDSTGDYVVTWQSQGQDGSGYGIYAQRYNSSGAVQGSEFRVNTYTTGNQIAPSVAMDSAGDFVITWSSQGEDGSLYGVYAQRYSSTGAVQGIEFQVNTYTTNLQYDSKVAMDSAGDFLITWQSYGQDGSGGQGTYAQRYNSSGNAQGSEFQVNTYTTRSQFQPSIAMDAAGDFVITWASDGEDGDGFGIYAQRYNSSGVSQGGEFHVNTYTTNQQLNPSVAMDSVGDFVIAWSSRASQFNKKPSM